MPCGHIDSVNEETFRLAVRLYTAVATRNTKFRPQCKICGSCEAFVCLDCDHMACLEHSAHDANHTISVGTSEASQAFAWCQVCRDLVTSDKTNQIRFSELATILGAGDPCGDVQSGTAIGPTFNAQQGLRGFYNMGATCYMAVSLQTLIHNPLVSQFFLSGGHDRSACPRSLCVQCCVDEVYCEFFSGETIESCGLPDMLRAVVKSSSAMFSGASEQDAHEFLQFVLDQFHQTHMASTGNGVNGSMNGTNGTNGSGTHGSTCSCISHRAFSGTLQNQLKCESCNFVKYVDDALMDISLQISGTSLEQSLEKFTAPETLSNYQCNNCQLQGSVQKSLKIATLPPILQIQLKRFRHEGATSSKVEHHVTFPLVLDLSKHTTEPNPSRPYLFELFGVLCHQGSLDTGHYTCMMKHSSGVWYQFDDTHVSPVNVQRVLNSPAYLLFYCTRWSI